jgi:ribosomal protein L11 methyltransferase
LPSRWYEIALTVPSALVDEAAALLDFAGFGGVEVRERAGMTDVIVVTEVDVEPAATQQDSEALRTRIRNATDAIAVLGCDGEPTITELDPKVWTENWKQHFARRTFAGRIEVRPPWEAPPASADLVSIVINPGMAFGTGLHETTAACLELLVSEVRAGMRVADIGCGSGILAIAAARLGAREVIATDVDPLAVDATNENIGANGVEDRVRVELEPGEVGIPEWEDARPGLHDARQEEFAATTARVRCDTKLEHVPSTGDAATASAQNGGACADTTAVTGLSAHGAGAFDLVVANILATTLVEMHDMLTMAVRRGGTLILSGIEVRRLKMVEETFIRPPWRLARTVIKGDWASMSLHSEMAKREDRADARA